MDNRIEEARERSAFWQRRLRRLGIDDECLLEFSRAMANDPHAAMMETGIATFGEAGQPLMDWLTEVAERPLPEYEVVDRETPVDAVDMQAALRERLNRRGRGAGRMAAAGKPGR